MSIHPITRRDALGRKTRAWRCRVRVRDANGRLEALERTFRADRGQTKAMALRWEREQLTGRDTLKQAPGSAPATRILDAIARYKSHPSYMSKEPASKERIAGILDRFAEWCKIELIENLDQFNSDIANRRFAAIVAEHRGAGVALVAIYEKKIFALAVERGELAKNPWPPVPSAKRRARLVQPKWFPREVLDALLSVAEPYEAAVWNLFANTGCRTKEIHHLTIEQISFLGTEPTEITIENHDSADGARFKVKNGRAHTVPLNRTARAGMDLLLAARDTSGYLIRRDWAWGTHPYLRNLRDLCRRAAQEYPELRSQLEASHVHAFRATFATNLLHSGADVRYVADLLGDEVSTVLLYYAAVLNEHKAEAVNRLDRITVPISEPHYNPQGIRPQ